MDHTRKVAPRLLDALGEGHAGTIPSRQVVRGAPPREDFGDAARLEAVSGIYSRLNKEAEMSEQEKFESEENENEDVEAHRRKLAEEPSEQEESSDDNDDVEAHRRRG